ncbi:receptor-like protein 12 [Durio zibethinus]|uniref:Receptor-like protein 12 n=1 Tax=Durio zibethinus TaxID=66656 RepID=A0A6P5Y1A2_DURZI|nr:receptor-like protein 12 [Durio zibethinus]
MSQYRRNLKQHNLERPSSSKEIQAVLEVLLHTGIYPEAVNSIVYDGFFQEIIDIWRHMKNMLSHNSCFRIAALEKLKDLESLDLSQNKLSGKIPPQLASLTFLEALNLSYDQLEGSLPQSNQFNTFSNDSYKGNPRLCGLHLSRKCDEVGVPMPLPKKDVDSWVDGISVWKIALIGYGSGLVIGLCMGYTVLNEFGNI